MGRIAGTDPYFTSDPIADNIAGIAQKRLNQLTNSSVSVSTPRGYSDELDMAEIDLARVNPRRF